MEKKRILIIEDENAIAEILEFNLRKNSYECVRVDSGEKALVLLDNGESFDLILLDLMLAGMDGTDFCRIYRSSPRFKQVPIIMLTARSEEGDIVGGLEFGADDYMTKPFSPRVLLARIRAQLRAEGRSSVPERKIFLHGIELDSDFHEAKVFGKSIDLTANEFGVLEMFMRSPGKVFTRDAIIRNLHGDGYPVTDRAVDVTIVNLRKKLGTNSSLIETVRGVGYRFIRA